MKTNYNNNHNKNNYRNNFKNNNKFKNNNYKNNYKNNKPNIKAPDLYYLSYFLNDSKKDTNKNKIKKYLIPLLTVITESKNSDDLNTKKYFSVIIRNKYERLPIEFKEEFIKLENKNIYEEEGILREKIDKSYKDALIFLRDFRNIMMHKNVKEETFARCKFNNFDGELFSFLRICLEFEYSLDENKPEENYINKILKMNSAEMKNGFKNIPFIYALIILAMFTERKYIKELLDLIKAKKFLKEIVSSFSLGGESKTLISGIAADEEELYFKQLEMQENINEEINRSGKRIIKELDYFNINKETINKNFEANTYNKLLKFYGYINTFPKVEELEENLKEFKAKEIIKNNIEKLENIKRYNQNAREYNAILDRGIPRLAIKNENKNFETDYKKIIPTIKNVFRNEDIFMKEAMEFLSSKYNNEFVNDSWTISGNAIIWTETNDNISFDIRKKVKPSKNSMNSIYKIVYNKENAGKFSLNRYNLRALITSILINGDSKKLNLKELKETASNNIKPKNKNSADTNNLSKDLKNKIPTWNRYNQASLIFKTVRKSIIKDIHLHNRDSVAFYKEFIRVLYSLNKNGNIYNDAIEIIHKYGIQDENISEEIRDLLKHNNLKDMALSSADILANLNLNKNNNKEKTEKQSTAQFKTWSKFAFAPVNEKNENIYKLLGWNDIKNNLNLLENNENNRIDIFEILFNYFNKNNMTYPHIVSIYKNFIKDNEIDYYAEKEIRNIIAEEMILYFIYSEYLKNINADNKNYFYFESGKDNKSLDFDLIWNLNPKIKINIKDYTKRDVKQSLDFIFDINRIKEDGKINGKEDLQKCLGSCLTNYNIVVQHNVLKSKCPQSTSIIKRDILNANNIKDIVKVLIWTQKELLYFICSIETYLIYKLSTSLTEHQLKSITDEYGYFNFGDLVENYNKISNNKIDEKLIIVRNELAHGRLTNYKTVIEIIDSSLQKLGLPSLYENYNRKMKR